MKIKHAYLNMKAKEDGRAARDFLLIAHNDSNERLSLISARHLQIAGDELLGKDVAIVSHLRSEKEDSFDPLIIENQNYMSTAAPLLSTALKKNRPRLDANTLNLRMLRLRAEGTGKPAKAASAEILRRISLSLAVFTFTFLGCAFGIEQGRNPSKRGLIAAVLLTLTVLVSYLAGKEMKGIPILALLAFLAPHFFIWTVSLFRLRKISRGIS